MQITKKERNKCHTREHVDVAVGDVVEVELIHQTLLDLTPDSPNFDTTTPKVRHSARDLEQRDLDRDTAP